MSGFIAPPSDDERAGAGDMRSAVSNAVVRLVRTRTGRGPKHARTIIQDDVVLVLLENVLTVAEDQLVIRGHAAEVLDLRHAIQTVMRPELVDAIEQITGRKVRAFMSTNHADPDIAAELFLLEAAT